MEKNDRLDAVVTGILIGKEARYSLSELCHETAVHTEWVLTLVEEGILNPEGEHPEQWRFPSESCHRISKVIRLQRDLGLNLAGVALALDLLEEVERLRLRLP